MNRAQRRLAASTRGKKKGLDKAGAKLDSAMETLAQMGGLEEATQALTEANKKLAEMQQLVEAVVVDNQTLADELEALRAEQVIQRMVTVQLMRAVVNQSGVGLGIMEDDIRQLEQSIRDEVRKAAEESSCEGT